MREKIRIAVCDDDEVFLNFFKLRLETELKTAKLDSLVVTFNNGDIFLEQLSEFDAVFLDIDMPSPDGMKLAEDINKIHPMPILFLTAYDELVYSSLRLQPFRFIRKSHMDAELEEAVCALDAHLARRGARALIYFRTPKGEITLPSGNIVYAEIYGHWIKVHTNNGDVFECYGSLNDFERQWENFDFVRCHKSYLVNCQYIYSICKKDLTLDNGERIYLSKHRIHAVKQKFETVMRKV